MKSISHRHHDPVNLLFEDLHVAMEDAAEADTAYHRRAYIRAAFSLLDAFIYSIKLFALHSAEQGEVSFTEAELTLLREEAYDVDAKGRVRSRPRFIRTEENLRFAASCYGRARGKSYTLHATDQEWRAFREAHRLRNRVTHPKTTADLEVSHEDIARSSVVAELITRVLKDVSSSDDPGQD